LGFSLDQNIPHTVGARRYLLTREDGSMESVSV
jgi:hypothetical protein